MASSEEPRAGNGRASGGRPRKGLYGGLPEAESPGLAPALMRFCDELRKEGMAVGTAEILDALAALEYIPWTTEDHFRSALASTIAKSQDDQFLFQKVFERFFFRAVEREAIERGVTEASELGGFERTSLAKGADNTPLLLGHVVLGQHRPELRHHGFTRPEQRHRHRARGLHGRQERLLRPQRRLQILNV